MNAMRIPIYREVKLGVVMITKKGGNLQGRVRWDDPQKRLFGSLWFPFVTSPSDGLGFGFSWRDESWSESTSQSSFYYDTKEAFLNYELLFNNRKSLTILGGYERQNLQFKEDSNRKNAFSHYGQLGLEWNQRIGLNPADSAQLNWKTTLNYISRFGRNKQQIGQFSTRVLLDWELHKDSHTELEVALGGGLSGSGLPLSRFFVLGIGQDNPLPLRAHPVVLDGYKGASPLGRRYFLNNFEFKRNLFRWKSLRISGSVFGDIGKVAKSLVIPYESSWYQDVGFIIQIGAFGFDLLQFTFGFDLKDSNFNLWIGLPMN